MTSSIIDDVKRSFLMGNMITRLIIINIAVFVIMALLQAFTPAGSGFFTTILHFLAVPGDVVSLLFKPWTLLTSMFLHVGFWHAGINMLYLYWFGRIVGDLIGDRHILPIYILGGLAGGIAYIASYQILGSAVIGSYALGASGAVMALVMVAGMVAPEHDMRLLIIGNVKLKYVVAAIIFFDLISISKMNNTGGHIAHLGGVVFGWYYMTKLLKGVDIADWFNGFFMRFTAKGIKKDNRHKAPMSVKYKSEKITHKQSPSRDQNEQDKIDVILEKIKKKGYNSLNDQEKETLYKASKS